MNDKYTAVLTEVSEERQRQDAKWGEQSHPDFAEIPDGMSAHPRENALAVIYSIPPPCMAKKACESQANAGKLSWMDILLEEVCELLEARDKAELRTELVQVAAVATAWAEQIDRDGGGTGSSWGEDVCPDCGGPLDYNNACPYWSEDTTP